MTLTNEQIQAIIDGAPEGATHYTDYPKPSYQKADGNKVMVWLGDAWYSMSPCVQVHNLSDLREILTLHQEVERLKSQQSEVAARAVEDAIVACGKASQAVRMLSGYYLPEAFLLNYANQLREQGE